MRALAIAALAGLSVGLLSWALGIASWNARVNSAAASLARDTKENPDPLIGGYVGDYFAPREASLTLLNGGCRSLPALVDSLDPALSPAALEALTSKIFTILQDRGFIPWGDRAVWVVRTHDPRRRAPSVCEMIRGWWAEHGGEVHRPWRFWTGTCATGPVIDEPSGLRGVHFETGDRNPDAY